MLLLRSITIVVLLSLASCGFAPMHGQKAAIPQLKLIEISLIHGRNGQLLRNALSDKLHYDPAASYQYLLAATIAVTPQAAGVEIDRNITRYNLHLLSTFKLIRKVDGVEIYSGKLRRISSYNVSDSDFSTFISNRDALERGVNELAEDYKMRLAAFFAKHPGVGY